jgi:amino acid permease
MGISAYKPIDTAIDDNAGVSSDRRTNAIRQSVFADEEGLTTFTGILAMISTCVGGGIVGLPYSMYHFGIPVALVMNTITATITCYSAYLYLKTKDLIPDKPESLFEIGYMVMGRKSIFMIAGIQIINAFGLMMIYFIVFGDTTGQLIANILDLDKDQQPGEPKAPFYVEKWFYIVIIAALLIPVII